jgi:hypothetical protein
MIQFDISALAGLISSGSEIISAKLWVNSRTKQSGGPFTYSLYRVLRNWNGGVNIGSCGTQPAAPGDVTWNSAQDSIVLWATPGVDNTVTDRAATPSAQFIQPGGGFVSDENTWYSFDVTIDVANMFDVIIPNYGWHMRVELPGPGGLNFFQSGAVAFGDGRRPYLEVEV